MHDTPKDTTFLLIDTLPSFNYVGLHRTIEPAKQMVNGKLQFCRDSLLSVYLEDNIHCSNSCEGIFQYTIQLEIDETGKLNAVIFEADKYNSNTLQNLVKEALQKICFSPAIKDKKNVSVKISVNVLIDLYNYPSEIRKALIKE
jgi:hypothetical protein